MPTLNIMPYMFILGLLTITVVLAYAGALLYTKHKEALWLASLEDMEAAPPTEEEQLIGDEWKSETVVAEAPAAAPAPPAAPSRIPMPKAKDMVGITYQQSVEHEQAFGNAVGMLGIEEGDPCVMCGKHESHDHTAADVRVYIERQARESFEKHVAEMDLTTVSADGLDKLLMRCKARIEYNASLAEMKRLDAVYGEAKLILIDQDQAAREDEEFYRKTCELAKAEAALPPQVLNEVPAKLDPDAMFWFDDDLDYDDELSFKITATSAIPRKKPAKKKPAKKVAKKKVAKSKRRR